MGCDSLLMSFRSVEVLTSSNDPKFCFWEELCVYNPKSTIRDLDMFQSKIFWLDVPSRKVSSKNYSTKKTYMKKSHFWCYGVTCGTRCSNMCCATPDLHQKDICYYMLQHLTSIAVVVSYFSIQDSLSSEDLQDIE